MKSFALHEYQLPIVDHKLPMHELKDMNGEGALGCHYTQQHDTLHYGIWHNNTQ